MCNDVEIFYKLIEKLKPICCNCFGSQSWERITLRNLNGHNRYWKKCKKGIYLFLDLKEKRIGKYTSRIVRVGTHAIKNGEGKATLWRRLRQHKGIDKNSGGNHRGSIFRLLVGEALINRNGQGPAMWGVGSSADRPIRIAEQGHEKAVSDYIRELPFLVVKVDKKEDRIFLEKNLIALISNINRKSQNPPCPDNPSKNWLGCCSCRPLVMKSGLWNNHYVGESYDPNCLDKLEKLIKQMRC